MYEAVALQRLWCLGKALMQPEDIKKSSPGAILGFSVLLIKSYILLGFVLTIFKSNIYLTIYVLQRWNTKVLDLYKAHCLHSTNAKNTAIFKASVPMHLINLFYIYKTSLLRIENVGICGSDVHYWWEGKCGRFVVDSPIVLGHESSGTVVKCGPGVRNLKAGDRVAIEPGVPCRRCIFCKEGNYNVCPEVKFCATPPVDGTLTQYFCPSRRFLFQIFHCILKLDNIVFGKMIYMRQK
ncbi:putative D-xylulose reductase A [Armadillidium vulgare]|nr:putative D-xylulose reductase A [Armadillidium vulgare]